MALAAGTRLGPYEIVAPLGAGGMGEVYKATDTRLSRMVAIKVLPPHWIADAEMKQRFEREAQTIASLKHPNICVLHDIGKGSVPAHEVGLPPLAVDYLVMEFLEGETLAERIKRGPIPLDEALDIAIAVTDALDKAHRQDVVHRDLKPSNVMLTPSGPKLLDFGLAKTYAYGSGGQPAGSKDPALQQPKDPALQGGHGAPGLQPRGEAAANRSGLTMPGMLIGTLQYMAPEQLEGGDADARTDIFALGVLLHEMVTGKKTFEGKSRVLLMSAIATAEPAALSTADPGTPPALDHVVRTCLAKEPADRWQTARDLLAELQAIASGADEGFVSASAARRKSPVLPRVLAGTALALGIALTVPAYLHLRAGALPDEVRFRIPIQLSADALSIVVAGVAAGNGGLFRPEAFAVSPDGRWTAFSVRPTGSDPWLIYVRPLGGTAPQRFPGTEDAAQTFWSADGRSLGFVAGGKLRQVDATGGPPQDVCPVKDFRGGSWNHDGVILFGSTDGLYRVPAAAGKPELVTTLDPAESGHFWPHFLPDGKRFLFTAWGQPNARGLYVGTLGSKERTRIPGIQSNAAYVEPTGPGRAGYLVFFSDRKVYAQPFDLAALALSGEPQLLADEVTSMGDGGRGHFSASRSGAVAYFQNSGATVAGGRQSDLAEWHLAWTNRTGQVTETPGPPGIYRGVELAPDSKRIAVHRHEKDGGEILVFEPTGAETRLTWDASQHNSSPIWAPDGKSIVYTSTRKGKVGLYRKPSDGSGVDELLFESELPKAAMSWSQDEKYIVFGVQDPKTGADLWLLTLADKKAVPFIATPYTETHAQISADGKWIAYASNSVGGRREIHVQAFPSGAGHWQPSDSGGDWPRWRKDTKELFYHSLGPTAAPSQTSLLVPIGPLYSVAVDGSGAAFVYSAPTEVLTLQVLGFDHLGGDYHTYAVAPEGQRFLYFQLMPPTINAPGAIGPDPTSGLMVVMNWLRRR